jgi:hypothetical protein
MVVIPTSAALSALIPYLCSSLLICVHLWSASPPRLRVPNSAAKRAVFPNAIALPQGNELAAVKVVDSRYLGCLRRTALL